MHWRKWSLLSEDCLHGSWGGGIWGFSLCCRITDIASFSLGFRQGLKRGYKADLSAAALLCDSDSAWLEWVTSSNKMKVEATSAVCIIRGCVMSGPDNKRGFNPSLCVYFVHVWVDAEPTYHVNLTGWTWAIFPYITIHQMLAGKCWLNRDYTQFMLFLSLRGQRQK